MGWRRDARRGHSSPRRHSNRALTDNGRDNGLRDSDNDSDNRSRVKCSVVREECLCSVVTLSKYLHQN